MPAHATPCDAQRTPFGRPGGASSKVRSVNQAAMPGAPFTRRYGGRSDAVGSAARAIRAGKAQRMAQEAHLRQTGHDALPGPTSVGQGIAPTVVEHT